MLRMVWKDDERYPKYWETIPGVYTVGDLAVKGKDGYIMILGRSDDIIVVAGHNIGTAEVEDSHCLPSCSCGIGSHRETGCHEGQLHQSIRDSPPG